MPPKFAVTEWNVYERTLSDMPRTNNNLEGFHNGLQKSVAQTHPNLWTLVSGLMKEESLARAKLAQYEQGILVKRIPKASEALKSMVQRYDPRDKMRYLRSVVHSLKHYYSTT